MTAMEFITQRESEYLDKYYTKHQIAEDCYKQFKSILPTDQDLLFIEPSAGAGAFLEVIQEPKLGFDIAPDPATKFPIIQNDFLSGNLLDLLTPDERQKQLVFIGNPPFGTKSKLAVDFLNKSLEYSIVVGFIVPIQFRKWSAQKRIDRTARLVLDVDLPENSFELMGKEYNVRCCFQIWVRAGFLDGFRDRRLTTKPSVSHTDFETYQYNRTEQAKKFFDYDWDFAVPRQGYLDYSVKAYSKSECDPKHQWIFFKARNEDVLERLKRLDFEKLSLKNIGIPGFGKADVVQEYTATLKADKIQTVIETLRTFLEVDIPDVEEFQSDIEAVMEEFYRQYSAKKRRAKVGELLR